jgi:Flp pilus assembly protein TadG
MTYKSTTKRTAEKGSAFVELALFTPALLLMLVGALDFARVYFADITLANAAEIGALYGARSVSASSDTAGMQTAATNDGKDLTTMTAVATNFCACGASGAHQTCPATSCTGANPAHRYVKVQTTYTFNTLFPIPGIPATVPMTRTAVIRVQ